MTDILSLLNLKLLSEFIFFDLLSVYLRIGNTVNIEWITSVSDGGYLVNWQFSMICLLQTDYK